MNVDNTDVIEEELLDQEEGKSIQEQINELKALQTRTPEQESELKRLKQQVAVDKRIAVEVAKRHQERERAERAEGELERLRSQSKVEPKRQPVGQAETVQINGREFYTDKGLVHLVNSNQMTQEEAYEHQEERREEKAVARLKQDMQQQSEAQVREETKKKVLNDYPEFDPKHADHNPNDPLFKEASRIWRNGYINNPRGLELAIDDAKRILGRDYKKPDLSQEFGVIRNEEPAARRDEKSKKVTLSDAEIETAYAYYRTTKNPKTGRSYTQSEAVEAATKAKQARQTRRI